MIMKWRLLELAYSER